jgi:methionyl-tRNA formyltransferase
LTSRAPSDLRAVVCAYGEVGFTCLDMLIELGVNVPLVVTHEDDPGEQCWFRSVRDRALEAGVPVITPPDVNAPEPFAALEEAAPDYLFSFYFRQMLRRPVLELPRLGALNMHGSLLPRFRGRAPVNWVLVEGEKETGVTLHYMDEKPDHGDVVAQRSVVIDRDDDALALTRKLAAAAAGLLRDVVPKLADGSAPRIPQDHERSTYFGGRRPEDGRIDWEASAERVRNLVRAVTDPWPGAFTELRQRKLLIWWAETAPPVADRAPGEIHFDEAGVPRVATAEGTLVLERVGWEGEPPMDGSRFAPRESIRPGERCGEVASRRST